MTKEELIEEIQNKNYLPGTMTSLIELIEKKGKVQAVYFDKQWKEMKQIEKLTCYLVTDRDFAIIFAYPLEEDIECGYRICSLEKFVGIGEQASLLRAIPVDPTYKENIMKSLEATLYFDVPEEELRKVTLTVHQQPKGQETMKAKNDFRTFLNELSEVTHRLHVR